MLWEVVMLPKPIYTLGPEGGIPERICTLTIKDSQPNSILGPKQHLDRNNTEWYIMAGAWDLPPPSAIAPPGTLDAQVTSPPAGAPGWPATV